MRPPPITTVTVLLSFLATGLAIELPALGGQLSCELRALQGGELWRLLSGPLVHTGLGHAARDLACLAGLGIVYERALGLRFLLALLTSTALPPLAAFLGNPAGTVYFGLSAAVYGVAVAAVVVELRRTRLRPGPITWALAVTVAISLGYELCAGSELLGFERSVAGAPGAHLAGALCGILSALPGRATPTGGMLEPCGVRSSSPP